MNKLKHKSMKCNKIVLPITITTLYHNQYQRADALTANNIQVYRSIGVKVNFKILFYI